MIACKNMPLLSICIATYNRAPFIGETLQSILPQLDDSVELLVVDGASTDDTEAVVAALADPSSRLRYIRLPQKGGVDQDYDRAAQEARGEYCWLFSDDDLLKPGTIVEVLRRLASAPSLVVVNAEARSADLSELQQERVQPATVDRTYAPEALETLFVDTANYLTFIGGIIIRRDIWLARARERYYGSAFIHVGVIFQAPLPGAAIVVAEPWIVIRYGNASWTGRAFEIWMVQWPRLVWSFQHFSAASRRAISRAEPWRSPLVLFLNRALAAYSIDIYHQKYAPLFTSARDRLMAQVIARIPGALANFGAVLAFRLFRPADKLFQVNLKQNRYSYRRVVARLFGGAR